MTGDDQDYRRQSRQPHRPQGGLLGKFPAPSQFKAGKDKDFRQSVAAEEGGRSSGPGRGGYDYDDGEEGTDEEPSYSRGGRGPYGGGRWSSGGGDTGEEEYDESGPGRWGGRGRGSPSTQSFSRGARGGGPPRGTGSWDSKRGPSRGLLETPRGGLLATPPIPPMHESAPDEDGSYHGAKRRRYHPEQSWDEEGASKDMDHDDVDDVDGSSHRGGYRGRSRGWGGGYSSTPRGSWAGSSGPMRGRGRGGRPGGPPRSRGRGRGRN